MTRLLKSIKGESASADERSNIWHKINGSIVNRPTKHTEHVYWEFSPYDVPEAVSGRLDERRGTARIMFKYLNDEPTECLQLNDFVVHVGRRSHRLHQVDMQASTVRKGGIVSAMTQVIERLTKDRPTLAPPDRYQIARDAVSRVGDSLLELTP